MGLRLKRSAVDNASIVIFLLLVLFIPNTRESARLYFAGLLVAIPLLLGNTRKLYFDYLTLAGLGMLIVFTISTVLRFFFIVDPNLRDYTELARVALPVLMLIFRDKFKNINIKTLFIFFAFYACADFLISVMDFLDSDIMGIVELTRSIYVSGGHLDALYRISGLSSGPSQHGTTMLVMFTFFYCRMFQRKKKAIIPAILAMMCTFPILLTQSRTSFIALVFVSIAGGLFFLFFGKKYSKRRSVLALFLFLGGGTLLIIQFGDLFSRILEIAEGIESLSSVQDRVEGYEMLLEKAMEYPAFLLIGYGKEFFQTSVFDSEYLKIFLIYGPLFLLLWIGAILIFVGRFLLQKNRHLYVYSTVLCLLLSAGLLLAFPTTYFLENSIIPLIFTFVNLAYWENKKQKQELAEEYPLDNS